MISYSALVSRLDAHVDTLLPQQILDASSPDQGGFVSPRDGMPGGTHIGCVQALGFAWLCRGSRHHGSEEILDRLLLGAAFSRHVRRPSGLFDLITTDWDSGPYTAFVVQAIAPMVAAARTSSLRGASDIAEQFGDIVRIAAPGMATGGFNTPNHRWVLVSALSQSLALYPELDVLPAIESYLAETIDINPDGEYTERSTGVYNAICNRSLRLAAECLDRPGLLDPIRRNLDTSYHLLHADGSVVTSLSSRQDRGQKVVPVTMADSYYALARLDGNGFYAAVADWLSSFGNGGVPWSLEPFITHPEWRSDDLAREPLPASFSRFMPASGVWRVRRDRMSATAATAITSPFSVRFGDIEVGVKICGCYFGTAQFRAGAMTESAGGVSMHFPARGSRFDGPCYYHPVGKPVSMAEYRDVARTREVTVLPPLEMTLHVTEVDGGFDLRLITAEPFDNIPVELVFAFSPGGVLQSDSLIAEGERGQAAFLRSGYAVYHKGNDAISVGPGALAHRMRDMRNSEPEPNAFRVLTTFTTPVDHAFQVRCGTWSEATASIISR